MAPARGKRSKKKPQRLSRSDSPPALHTPGDAPLVPHAGDPSTSVVTPLTVATTYGSALTGDPLSPMTAASTPGSSLTGSTLSPLAGRPFTSPTTILSASGSPVAEGLTGSTSGSPVADGLTGSPLTAAPLFPLTAACVLTSPKGAPAARAVATESEDSLTSTCDMEVAHVLTSATPEKILTSPYKATTVMTNIQRGNVQTETPQYLTSQRDRDLSQLAGQGELNMIKAVVQSEGSSVVTSRDAHGLSLLEWAAFYGQVECVRYLVGVAPPGGLSSSVQAALLLGASRGHAGVCQVLLDQGRASVDFSGPDGVTPLMYAIHGDHGRTVDVLLRRGASLAARVAATPTTPGAAPATVMDFAVERRHRAPIAMQAIENYVMGLLNGSPSS